MEDVQDLHENRKRCSQSPEGAIPKTTIIDVSLIGREYNYITPELNAEKQTRNQVLKQKERKKLREDHNFKLLGTNSVTESLAQVTRGLYRCLI
ncbi:hypothetical protein SK128_006720, partial [Halocaridina rubra]